ncbi:hypothetical protein G3142_005464 [Salmonella enterica subsp. enterica serovar Montevideo]|nr:hypothetical protein [Salmonella enterica subsp. enterica serovar Montevideo]EEK7814339.1 hypothetical protein [Salmonella enterica subsp. enterica serovar Montevideo]
MRNQCLLIHCLSHWTLCVGCREPHSGQSHQLSTGTVKKPTSPVGFFTSVF